MLTLIAFKRPRTEVRNDFHRRVSESKCGRYRVVLSRCLLGPRTGPEALSPVVYAMHFNPTIGASGLWEIISTHRKPTTAMKACDQHARTQMPAHAPATSRTSTASEAAHLEAFPASAVLKSHRTAANKRRVKTTIQRLNKGARELSTMGDPR